MNMLSRFRGLEMDLVPKVKWLFLDSLSGRLYWRAVVTQAVECKYISHFTSLHNLQNHSTHNLSVCGIWTGVILVCVFVWCFNCLQADWADMEVWRHLHRKERKCACCLFGCGFSSKWNRKTSLCKPSCLPSTCLFHVATCRIQGFASSWYVVDWICESGNINLTFI